MSPYDQTVHLSDGGQIQTSSEGQWDLCLPNNEHHRGQAADRVSALQAAQERHIAWSYDIYTRSNGLRHKLK